jgi:hypothetical protein
MAENKPTQENKESEKSAEQKASDAVSAVENKTPNKWVDRAKGAAGVVGFLGGGLVALLSMATTVAAKSVELAAALAQGFLQNTESPSKWFSQVAKVEIFKKEKGKK